VPASGFRCCSGRAKRHILSDSLAAGACTEAALALLELEMPNWKIRRLINEGGGEWLCSLSRQPGVPTEFDDMVETRHAVLSLAVLRALFEAEAISTPADVPLGATTPFCCDNFA
jgi:hypothetical protein